MLPAFSCLPEVLFFSGSAGPEGVCPPRYSLDVSELTAHPVQEEPAFSVSATCSADTAKRTLRFFFSFFWGGEGGGHYSLTTKF